DQDAAIGARRDGQRFVAVIVCRTPGSPLPSVLNRLPLFDSKRVKHSIERSHAARSCGGSHSEATARRRSRKAEIIMSGGIVDAFISRSRRIWLRMRDWVRALRPEQRNAS